MFIVTYSNSNSMIDNQRVYTHEENNKYLCVVSVTSQELEILVNAPSIIMQIPIFPFNPLTYVVKNCQIIVTNLQLRPP
jgi:hypothetical protein